VTMLSSTAPAIAYRTTRHRIVLVVAMVIGALMPRRGPAKRGFGHSDGSVTRASCSVALAHTWMWVVGGACRQVGRGANARGR
jgi:hypothetical protein